MSVRDLAELFGENSLVECLGRAGDLGFLVKQRI